jgi:hypothetical protein
LEKEMNKWATLFTLKNPLRAATISQFLEENGVETVIIDKTDRIYPIFNLAELRVNAEKLPLAQALISTFEIHDSEYHQ